MGKKVMGTWGRKQYHTPLTIFSFIPSHKACHGISTRRTLYFHTYIFYDNSENVHTFIFRVRCDVLVNVFILFSAGNSRFCFGIANTPHI